MAIPLPQAFMYPVLRVLARCADGARVRELAEPVADEMQLTVAERAEHLPSGNKRLRYVHRMGWGLNMLKATGHVMPPSDGKWRITAEGLALLRAHPDGLDEDDARQLARSARELSRRDDEDEVDDARPTDGPAPDQSPEERIDAALSELRRSVARDLLERILQAPPSFFEELVLDLLHALGYGRESSDLEHVGRSGDGGIDGIISLDQLGFEKVYVQAKRWQNAVGRPEVQAFYGALAGRRAKKGVVITTSTFTREAREFALHVSDSIVLVDGARLTDLMMDHGVAVTHYRTVQLPRVDGDYFDLA